MMTRCHQMTGQQRRSGHPEKQWYLMQERRDSRLISPKSCPTDWVHLTETTIREGVVSQKSNGKLWWDSGTLA